MPTRASPRCCSSRRTRATSARSATRTRKGSTKRSRESPCRSSKDVAPYVAQRRHEKAAVALGRCRAAARPGAKQRDRGARQSENDEVRPPPQLRRRDGHLQEVHREVERPDEQAQQHGPLQPLAELRQDRKSVV